VGHLLTVTGKIDDAGRVLEQALRLMPDYHYALAALAKVRAAEERHLDAVSLLRTRYEFAPHPENLFDLGVALHRAGKVDESAAIFADFERKALAESQNEDNANRELIAFYADYAQKPGEAHRIAKQEIARRHDVLTLDALAWALHKSGRDTEALPHIERAVAVGTVDTRILYHAGAIAKAAGNTEAARRYLQRSLEVNARSEVATDARRLLSSLAEAGKSRTVAAVH
jgi:tetratricopeptide (TPR) repeat protein